MYHTSPLMSVSVRVPIWVSFTDSHLPDLWHACQPQPPTRAEQNRCHRSARLQWVVCSHPMHAHKLWPIPEADGKKAKTHTKRHFDIIALNKKHDLKIKAFMITSQEKHTVSKANYMCMWSFLYVSPHPWPPCQLLHSPGSAHMRCDHDARPHWALCRHAIYSQRNTSQKAKRSREWGRESVI